MPTEARPPRLSEACERAGNLLNLYKYSSMRLRSLSRAEARDLTLEPSSQ
ncbi:MAG: hypothetical protein CEO40_75 [Parcubacteria group bacterium LiPW_72]|nr:MAG: hypothetical protein CEO40_75 [Parcubacteria group bacterium LiPW_72]